MPGRQVPTPFRRIELGQRPILYWRGDQILPSRIEGEIRGEPRAVEWQWQAVPLVPESHGP